MGTRSEPRRGGAGIPGRYGSHSVAAAPRVRMDRRLPCINHAGIEQVGALVRWLLGLDTNRRSEASLSLSLAAKSAAKLGKTMSRRGPAGNTKTHHLNSAARLWGMLGHL